MKFTISSASGALPDDPRIREETFIVPFNQGYLARLKQDDPCIHEETFQQIKHVIDLDSLEDLLAFARLYGDVIVKAEDLLITSPPSLLIYDDYLE